MSLLEVRYAAGLVELTTKHLALAERPRSKGIKVDDLVAARIILVVRFEDAITGHWVLYPF